MAGAHDERHTRRHQRRGDVIEQNLARQQRGLAAEWIEGYKDLPSARLTEQKAAALDEAANEREALSKAVYACDSLLRSKIGKDGLSTVVK